MASALKDMLLAKRRAAQLGTTIGHLACDLFALHCRSGHAKPDRAGTVAMVMKIARRPGPEWS